MDTIDVEGFASAVKTGLVMSLKTIVEAEIATLAPWIGANPFFAAIEDDALEWILSLLAGKGGLAAFVINTKAITIDQAKDLMAAVNKVTSLPETVSDDEWDKAEREANETFRNLFNFKR